MKRLIALVAAMVGGVIVFRSLAPARHRLTAAIRRRMLQRMEQMMASLPENAPPKLVMSVLPQLRDQNDQSLPCCGRRTNSFGNTFIQHTELRYASPEHR